MAEKIANGDIELVSYVAEYKFLTVKLLSALTQRSNRKYRTYPRSVRSDSTTSFETRLSFVPRYQRNVFSIHSLFSGFSAAMVKTVLWFTTIDY